MKLFDELGNEVTDQYIRLSGVYKLREENCCLKQELKANKDAVAELSKVKKKRKD